jgi:polyphosphate kinase 2
VKIVINYKLEEYANKLTTKQYTKEKLALQAELLKLQEWVIKNKKKLAIVVEGRDTAGKGSTIKRFVERLIERKSSEDPTYRVVSLGIPTPEESKNWFERYERHLPRESEIVFFDRSWYNRAIVEPAMGYCSKKQYKHFMENVNEWERKLQEEQDIILIKLYLDIDKTKQKERIAERQESPLKYWKFSMNDFAALGKWEALTSYQDQMFDKTSTEAHPWVTINSNNKMIARLTAIRYVLSVVEYDNKTPMKKKRWAEKLRELEIDGVMFKDLTPVQFNVLQRLSNV